MTFTSANEAQEWGLDLMERLHGKEGRTGLQKMLPRSDFQMEDRFQIEWTLQLTKAALLAQQKIDEKYNAETATKKKANIDKALAGIDELIMELPEDKPCVHDFI